MNRKAVKGKTANRDGREKKLADEPDAIDEMERKGAEQKEAKGFPSSGHNKNLWSDRRHPNEARQQVKGGSEKGFTDAGIRSGESEHGFEPHMSHYDEAAGEVRMHQDAIIDKHSPKAGMFKHASREKEAYSFAKESTAKRKK